MRLVLTLAPKFEALGIINEVEEYGEDKPLSVESLVEGLRWISSEAFLFLKSLGPIPHLSLVVVPDDSFAILATVVGVNRYDLEEQSSTYLAGRVFGTIADLQKESGYFNPSLPQCKTCGEPVVSPDGVLDLNDDGECEACAENWEYMEGFQEDHHLDVECGWDFDYSMNN